MTDEVVIEQNPTENLLQAEPPAELVAETPVEAVIESEPTPEAVQEQEDKRKNPWFLKRISAEAEARRAAEQRAADAEAMLQRLQANKEETRPEPTSQPDFQTAVQREAARMRLAEDSTAIRDAGFKEFGQSFSDNLAVLNAAGAVSDDIVLDLIAVDKANAHKILAHLASDPEKAAALASMDPRRRTVELTRISMAKTPAAPPVAAAPKAPPAKQVSKAPPPAPPVEPSASKTVDWRTDDADDETFNAGFREMMAKRNVRR